MSEKLHHSPEQHSSHETAQSNELLKDKIEAGKDARNEHAEALDQIRHSIDKQALAAEKSHVEQEQQQPTQHVTKELKNIQYKETMRYVRRHLSKRERKFSSFIHAPSVEKLSEVSAKTIARPSGLLGGGFLALVGSITVLYFARKYGFEVPNSLFMALFILGFATGLLAELVMSGFSIRRNKRYKNYQ
jgi:hypothetical protein